VPWHDRADAADRCSPWRWHDPSAVVTRAEHASTRGDPPDRHGPGDGSAHAGGRARDRALAEGEEILRNASISHHYLSFYRDAVETCLANGDWSGAEQYASALEEYTQPEPLPLSNFFIARGRALADSGRGRSDAALKAELVRLRDEGERLGVKTNWLAGCPAPAAPEGRT